MSLGFMLFFLILFVVVFLATFAVVMIKRNKKDLLSKPQRKLFAKIQSMCSTMGLLGLLWLFFAYEQVPLLSSRFWVPVLGIIAGLWIYSILRYSNLEMKPQLQQIAEKERIEKWLPKKS